ncbi:hypothetical protein Tco_1261683, partial [Tanacetum coccineum]
APRSKDNKNWNQGSSTKTVKIEDASEKVMCAIDGAGFDWSDMAEKEIQANMALMAFLDSEVNTVYTRKVTTVRVKKVCTVRIIREKVSTVSFVREKFLAVKGWLVEDLVNYHLKELRCSAQCHTKMSMWINSRGDVFLEI